MPILKNIFVGDIGTIFEGTIKENGVIVDISAATELKILFLRPDDSVLNKTAVLSTDGLDGKLRYVGLLGDITLSGTWQWQALVTLPTGGPFHTNVKSFRVDDVIA